MAMNNQATYVQPGHYIEITAAANQARGDVVILGSLVGVATKDALAGATDQVIDVDGVYDIVKAAAVTFTAGAVAYWNGTAVDANVAGTPLGLVIVPAAGSATHVRVKLIPTIPA